MADRAHDPVAAEGWFLDPFDVHEVRWFSGGMPTALVRDRGVESNDEPPDEAMVGELVRVEGVSAVDGNDLRRTDSDVTPIQPRQFGVPVKTPQACRTCGSTWFSARPGSLKVQAVVAKLTHGGVVTKPKLWCRTCGRPTRSIWRVSRLWS